MTWNARSTASAASRARTISPAGTPRLESSQVSIPTTGFPVFSASAISDSVPNSPPMAMTTSAARTTSAFRASPSPVGIATSTQAFASPRSVPGRIPTVVPPVDFAPRQTASITPPRPPQTTTARRLASSRPTSSAWSNCSRSAAPEPTTATWRTRCMEEPSMCGHSTAVGPQASLERDSARGCARDLARSLRPQQRTVNQAFGEKTLRDAGRGRTTVPVTIHPPCGPPALCGNPGLGRATEWCVVHPTPVLLRRADELRVACVQPGSLRRSAGPEHRLGHELPEGEGLLDDDVLRPGDIQPVALRLPVRQVRRPQQPVPERELRGEVDVVNLAGVMPPVHVGPVDHPPQRS